MTKSTKRCRTGTYGKHSGSWRCYCTATDGTRKKVACKTAMRKNPKLTYFYKKACIPATKWRGARQCHCLTKGGGSRPLSVRECSRVSRRTKPKRPKGY